MQGKVIIATSGETIHPGIVPDIGAVATTCAKPEVVDVAALTDLKDEDQLMLRAVEAPCPPIPLFHTQTFLSSVKTRSPAAWSWPMCLQSMQT